ncbi:MAG TPA: dTMP kinase [Candidatus Dormibacteraeota bacterium]|nr:dTMP kinase [Candidatus Dormibacteraeota bacterium]
MSRGKYIVLEGPEGVGKTTQLLEMTRRLRAAGLPVRSFREPDSQSDLTARAIRQLTQDPHFPMNTNTEVLLYNAARSQSLQVIKTSVEQGLICLVDRNYLTTLAIQYYGRGDVPDYEMINRIIDFAVNGVEPDLCIILDAPATTLKERLQGRGQGERFDDLDVQFLERVRAGYLWEAKQRNLPVVFATESLEKASDQIWQLIAQTLAVRNPSKAAVAQPEALKSIIENKKLSITTTVSTVNNKPTPDVDVPLPSQQPLLEKKDNHYQITAAGQQYLDQVVTNSSGNVYAFTDKINPLTVAAAMARLSRRGDDMRITLLDEFASSQGKDENLLQRVITAYGDDSVQQLAGIHVVVENASNLLTKKLEWGRLAAYLEQSTRYIYFDQTDANGKYKYFTPTYLDEKTKQQYEQIMDQIFQIYSEIVHRLTEHVRLASQTPEKERDNAWLGATRAQACDAARPILPVATKSTVGIFASGQAFESLIMHLLSDELPEARLTGQALLTEGRKIIPVFLERADKPERGGATIAYSANTKQAMKHLASKELPINHAQPTSDPVELVDFWPKNELELIPDMLYEHSALSLKQIQNQVNAWSYEKKVGVFKTYIGERLNRRHKPGRALEKVHYSWDIVCDYGIFRDLQRHRMVEDLEWQELTPRFGFEVPELIDQAGLSEQFEHCFDLSLKLYSHLQSAGYLLEAQYATLLGHKMRWKVSYNARQAFHLHEIRTSPQGHPGYRKLVLQMHEKVAAVHPLTADAMSFVNKADDPKLNRLAAERYTQYKLTQLKH